MSLGLIAENVTIISSWEFGLATKSKRWVRRIWRSVCIVRPKSNSQVEVGSVGEFDPCASQVYIFKLDPCESHLEEHRTRGQVW